MAFDLGNARRSAEAGVPAPEQKATFDVESARRAAKGKEKEAWYEDLAEGVGVSALDTYYGVKDLVSEVDDEDRATLKDWKQDAAESGWGTAGQVAGEVAQFMIPGGALMKGAKLANKARKIPLLTKALNAAGGTALRAEVAGAGALGATQLPEEGESRLGNAAKEMGMAFVGGKAGEGLSKAVRGIKKSKAGQELLDQGVPLTPGQAAESKGVQGFESLMELTPGLARGTKKVQEKASRAWDLHVMNKAAPDGVTITKSGTDGFGQLKQGVDDAYTAAWNTLEEVPSSVTDGMKNQIDDLLEKVDFADARVLNKVKKDIAKLADGPAGMQTKALDNTLRKEMADALDNHGLMGELQALKEMLRDGVPEVTRKALNKIDAKYPDYLAIRKATAKARASGGEFNTKDLASAGGIVGGETRSALGTAPMLKQAVQGQATLGNSGRGELIGYLRRALNVLPTVLPLKTLGRGMLGQTGPQKVGQKVLDSGLSDYLRKYAGPAKLSAGYYGSVGEEDRK